MATRARRRTPHPLDAATHLWMAGTGHRVDAGSVPWLLGPFGDSRHVGDAWVERLAVALSGHTDTGPDHGLLPSFGALAGPGFAPDDVDPRIADFYTHTARWRLDVWSEWSAAAWPFGRALTALWSERLQQLSLPMRPLDVALGMDSSVVHIHDRDGRVAGAAWLRTTRRTGATVYSGYYGTVTRPGNTQPRVRVVFPLPSGCLTVLLRPAADTAGGLRLVSPAGGTGGDGAYLVLDRSDHTLRVRRVPIAERFHLYVDDDGDVRCDHNLRLGRVPALHLHYRMRRDRP